MASAPNGAELDIQSSSDEETSGDFELVTKNPVQHPVCDVTSKELQAQMKALSKKMEDNAKMQNEKLKKQGKLIDSLNKKVNALETENHDFRQMAEHWKTEKEKLNKEVMTLKTENEQLEQMNIAIKKEHSDDMDAMKDRNRKLEEKLEAEKKKRKEKEEGCCCCIQ